MDKSPDAFRTISEVAEVLDTPAHVLRFWESRFPQIRPVKRAGGRRYYRPADVALLMGIRHLLHEEGLTIRGVQKILREQGIRHVSDLSGQSVSDEAESAETALEQALAANFGIRPAAPALPPDQIETAQVVALEGALRQRSAEAPSLDTSSMDTPSLDSSAEVLPLFDLPAQAKDQANPATAPDAAMQAEPELGDMAAPAATPEPAFTGQGDAVAPDHAAPAAPALPPLPQEASLLARLRALPPGSLASAEARALRLRLADLAGRLGAVSPQPPA